MPSREFSCADCPGSPWEKLPHFLFYKGAPEQREQDPQKSTAQIRAQWTRQCSPLAAKRPSFGGSNGTAVPWALDQPLGPRCHLLGPAMTSPHPVF